MSNLKAIRRRIGSVKNTQKITRAMKMVAAARLRKADEAAKSFRAYADLTSRILTEVAGEGSGDDHPLLKRREVKRTLLLVICSDRGLCGGFNGNLCRDGLKRIREIEGEAAVEIVGRKAIDYFERRGVAIEAKHLNTYEGLTYATAARIARELARKYEAGEFDRIELAYNQLVSMISQKPTFQQLLPVVLPEKDESQGAGTMYLFEPGREELLGRLLPRYMEVQVFRALLESVAAEHAARMTAMDNATNNAEEMLDHLTLVYNRARQSAITKELMDIVGGAEALND